MPSKNKDELKSKSGKPSFIPRSIFRTLGKVKQALDPNAEAKFLEEFRTSRYQTVTSIRYLIILLIAPLLVNQISKTFVINPIVYRLWGQKQEVFLNSSQEERALTELKKFEQVIYFKFLLGETSAILPETIEKRVKQKANVIYKKYKSESINVVSNVFADILSVFMFFILVITNKQKIIVLKSFSDELIYGLSDSAKAFFMILFTDMFVGFHSPYGWEVILENSLKHFGLPENGNFISLFIATFPVILDTVFKYWIFRYLNRTSPSSVATYHKMNE